MTICANSTKPLKLDLRRFLDWTTLPTPAKGIHRWYPLCAAILLLLTVGCETVWLDGIAKKQIKHNYLRRQDYPPRFASYKEPHFNYQVRWNPSKGQVRVRLHPLKSVRFPKTNSTIAELSHNETTAPCANCAVSAAARSVAPQALEFTFNIPPDAPKQQNQIYYFKVRYSPPPKAEMKEETLFFYNQAFYPNLVHHYASRRAKIRRLSGTREYLINGGDHEPMKMIWMEQEE